MDQVNATQSLGERIVSAARLAAALHLGSENLEGGQMTKNSELVLRQRDLIGGTDQSVRCTCDGCGHTGSSDADPVTDDVLRSSGR